MKPTALDNPFLRVIDALFRLDRHVALTMPSTLHSPAPNYQTS